jgi:hypothetical protein
LQVVGVAIGTGRTTEHARRAVRSIVTAPVSAARVVSAGVVIIARGAVGATGLIRRAARRPHAAAIRPARIDCALETIGVAGGAVGTAHSPRRTVWRVVAAAVRTARIIGAHECVGARRAVGTAGLVRRAVRRPIAAPIRAAGVIGANQAVRVAVRPVRTAQLARRTKRHGLATLVRPARVHRTFQPVYLARLIQRAERRVHATEIHARVAGAGILVVAIPVVVAIRSAPAAAQRGAELSRAQVTVIRTIFLDKALGDVGAATGYA